MHDPDRLVIVFDYEARDGSLTRRVASPIRWMSGNSFLALCLCREEPRRFDLDRCKNLSLAPAWQFSMPVPLMPVPSPAAPALCSTATLP